MNLVSLMAFLHITFVFFALGIMMFAGILLQQIALSGDAPAIRTAFRVGMYHGRVGGLLLFAGVVFGFATASLDHFPLQTGWLIAAYIAVLLIAFLGVAFHQRHEMAIFDAASSGRDDAGAECIRLAKRQDAMVLNLISSLIWVFAIYDMVAKPF